MATAGVINGTLLRIYLDGVAIGYATSCTLSLTREMRDILTKDSPGNGWQEGMPGQKSGTLSTEGLFSFDTPNTSPIDLFDALDQGTRLIARFSTEVSGDTYFQCGVYCTSYEVNTPVEENSTYSVSFQVDGAVTKAILT